MLKDCSRNKHFFEHSQTYMHSERRKKKKKIKNVFFTNTAIKVTPIIVFLLHLKHNEAFMNNYYDNPDSNLIRLTPSTSPNLSSSSLTYPKRTNNFERNANNQHRKKTTSLNVFFRKNANEQNEKKQKDTRMNRRNEDGEGLKSRNFFYRIKKPFKKITAIRSTYIDSPPSLVAENLAERDKEIEKRTGCRIVESTFLGFFQRRSSFAQHLTVHADPKSNSLSRLLRGKIGTVHVNFDRLVFPRIQISGGGQFRLPNGFNFALLSVPSAIQTNFGIKRFTSSFELEANNVIFIQEDVMTSFWIRRGVELLLNRILKSVVVRTMGGVAVVSSAVKVVEILVSNVDLYVSNMILEFICFILHVFQLVFLT